MKITDNQPKRDLIEKLLTLGHIDFKEAIMLLEVDGPAVVTRDEGSPFNKPVTNPYTRGPLKPWSPNGIMYGSDVETNALDIKGNSIIDNVKVDGGGILRTIKTPY